MLKKSLGKKKARNFLVSFVSSICFLVLAVYGWGLSLRSVAVYFVILMGFLLAIIIAAMFVGWLLRRFNAYLEK